MPAPAPQSYRHHARRVPWIHATSAVILGIAILLALADAVWHPSFRSIVLVIVALALLGSSWYGRTNALVVQDRVIRLEERLRLERLLPADLRPRIEELSVGQLVALRFASDGELPDLVRQVFDEKLTHRDEIKRRIRDWRPDHLRV
jgi:hypothetical protein